MASIDPIIISHEKPPIYDRLNAKFGVKWEDIIVAYDGKIHCSKNILPQKIVHEKVHLDEQKKIGNDAWWNLYLDSSTFRLEEEFKAYKAETDFIKRNIKNREHRFHMIRDIAASFAGDTYGNIITKDQAMKLLL